MTPPTDHDDFLHPEQKARRRIDAMLDAAGWVVQDYRPVNLYAGPGVAARELVTTAVLADYVLFVTWQAIGVIEAKAGHHAVWGGVADGEVRHAHPRRAAGVSGGRHLPSGYV